MNKNGFENISLWDGKSWSKTIGKVLGYLRNNDGKSIGYILGLEDGSKIKAKHGSVVFLDKPRGFRPLKGLRKR